MRRALRWTVFVAAAALGVALLLGLAFAGSPSRLAQGVTVAGVDVGGLTPDEAMTRLERRAQTLAASPVTFIADGHRFAIRPDQLGVESDWRAGVAAAERQSDGFGPIRGLRRLRTRLFGTDVTPPVRIYDAALDYKLGQLSRRVNRPHVEAKLVRRGLHVALVPGQNGLTLDHHASGPLMVAAPSEKTAA